MLDDLEKNKPHSIVQRVQQLQDPRMLGLVVFAVIVLLMSYSGVKIIHTNYQLQQQIAQRQQENDIQKLKNENLKLKNQYYNTPQYLELSARQNFGLAMPGEKVLLVPKAVAEAHIPADTPTISSNEEAAAIKEQPFMQRNFQAWADFFLHRTTSAPTESTD